jgi:ketosteroid isomerase-like protein
VGEPDDLRTFEAFRQAQGAFYRGGPAEPLAGLLAEDVTWIVPGRNAIAGTYRGRQAVMDYFARRRDLTDASFEITTRRVLSDDQGVVAFAGGRARRGGVEKTWETVGVYDIEEGKVVRGMLLPFDQAEFDEIWRD